jgi:hypothetical protein
MSTAPYALVRASIAGGAPQTGGITATGGQTCQFSADPAGLAGAYQYLWELLDYPPGYATPAGWTLESDGRLTSTAQTPPVITLDANAARWGKYIPRLTLNGGGPAITKQMSIAQIDAILALTDDETTAVKVLSPNGQHDIGVGEKGQFGGRRGWVADLKTTMRVVEVLLGGGGGSLDHGALTGLGDDDHTQYDLAQRTLVSYTSASNDAALVDARKFIVTTRATAIGLRIRAEASIAWAAGTLLYGVNTGAGTLTVTLETGTLNGTATVAQNGWWWAKKTGTNTWQIFTGGAGGTGDFKSDGSVPMSAALNVGTNKIVALAAGTVGTDAVNKSQLDAVAAAASGKYGFQYTFDNNTANADPGSGKFRLDSATLSAVAKWYVDLLDADGNDLTNWLAALDDAIGTVKGFIYFRDLADDTKWGMYRLDAVTTLTGYVRFDATYIVAGSGGLPSTSAGGCLIEFDAWGNGAAAGNGLTGTNTHSVLADDASISVGVAGIKVASQLPARGSENVVIDLYPSTQQQGTINTGSSVNIDVPIATGKRYTITWDVWVDDGAGGACLYAKAVQVKYHQTGGAAVEVSEVTVAAPLEGAGFTFTVAPSTTNARGTLSNTSGTNRTYNIAVGYWAMDKP